jgi:hypothetical protein
MDERRALLVDFLKVNDKLARIMLGVRQDLRTEQSDDVIRNDASGLVLEVGVVNTEVSVEPVDLAGDELARNKALGIVSEDPSRVSRRWHKIRLRTFAATSFSTRARCSSLPLKTGVVYPGKFLIRLSEVSLVLRPAEGLSAERRLGSRRVASAETGVDIARFDVQRQN